MTRTITKKALKKWILAKKQKLKNDFNEFNIFNLMLCVILCKSFKVINMVVGTKIGSFGNFYFMYDVYVVQN